jgi:hypothetical protein
VYKLTPFRETRVIQRWSFQRWSFGTLLLTAHLAACGGAGSGTDPVKPAPSAAGAVQSFMRAVSDSNLTGMAELWGTSRGPAARTRQPTDYERRIVVIQSYLRHDDYRITTDVANGDDKRDVRVELRRQACTWTVPFTLVKLGDGSWIVSQVDVTQAGNPARPCDPNAPRDSAPGAEPTG